ncbi:hypothetical protein [Dyadobacter fanqingshengii]|uniref:Uncharacterized protein n=1 Tax=Dyadobacter fanqingshengii TaxID=2906443 RepID=A0A9X1P784_9BACT|nr:hypothetical protein [Dyadobacter fanqingshengii]MCF0039242.1 hypothetical protein [Dyadobacter fanqingshengii]USJ33941.1 hypothetical protein NFI81_14615 [Dyadobacter fanqingshengii]
METTTKRSRKIPVDPQKQAVFLRQLLKEIGGRDLFPKKTAGARKFLEGLQKAQPNSFPKPENVKA